MRNKKGAGYKIAATGMAAALMLTTVGVLYAKRDDSPEKKENTAVAAAEAEEKEESLSLLNTDRKIGKEETVYVLAGADGAPEKVIVSNWLKNPEQKDQLKDKSELENIVNVKGEESYSIDKDGMQVWEAGGKDIYYQGTTGKELPVEVTVSYQLDGKTVSAEELAGKSGAVTIRFDYTNHQKETVEVNGSSEDLYVPFAMISSMILDNQKFSNIQVTNGKLINDGDRSIVVGFALPGLQENLKLDAEKAEIPDYVEITADVTDFELITTLTVASNELLQNVNLDNVTTLEELEQSLNTLSESSRQLVDGSTALREGIATLSDKSKELIAGVDQLYLGAEQLKDGAGKLDAGAKELDQGAAELQAGVQNLQSGAGELNTGAQKLAAGAPELQEGIKTLQDGLGYLTSQNDRLINGAAAVFQSLLNSANSQLTAAGLTLPAPLTMENYETVLTQVIAALAGNPAQASVQGVLQQLQSYQEFYDGLGAYTGGVAKAYQGMVDNKMADGAAALAAGTGELAGGTQKLLAGTGTLASGTQKLKDGTASLVAGTGELAAGTGTLLDGIGTLKTGSGALIDGVSQLNDGAIQLSDGMKKFDEEGIQKIVNAYNGDIKGLIARLKATVEASKQYQSFSGKTEEVEGSVQFIFRTEGIEGK